MKAIQSVFIETVLRSSQLNYMTILEAVVWAVVEMYSVLQKGVSTIYKILWQATKCMYLYIDTKMSSGILRFVPLQFTINLGFN